MSVANILFFLIGCGIVLRIYFAVRRIENNLTVLVRKLGEEETKRMRHAELMRVEMDSLTRTKEKLDAQVAECRSHLDITKNTKEVGPNE